MSTKKQITKTLILEEIKNKFDSNSYEKFIFELRRLASKDGSKNDYVFTVEKMYNYVDFDFENLEFLSKLFKTKKINIGSRWSSAGCDTCDYGSRYVVDIYILESEIDVAEMK